DSFCDCKCHLLYYAFSSNDRLPFSLHCTAAPSGVGIGSGGNSQSSRTINSTTDHIELALAISQLVIAAYSVPWNYLKDLAGINVHGAEVNQQPVDCDISVYSNLRLLWRIEHGFVNYCHI